MKPEGDRIAELSSEAKAWTRNTTGQPAGNMGTQYAYKEDPQQKLSKAARCSPPFDGLTFTDAAAVAAVAGSLHLVASTLSREKPSDALVIDSTPWRGGILQPLHVVGNFLHMNQYFLLASMER